MGREAPPTQRQDAPRVDQCGQCCVRSGLYTATTTPEQTVSKKIPRSGEDDYSRAIVEAHEGTIGFDDVAAGGTRFWIRLPVTSRS